MSGEGLGPLLRQIDEFAGGLEPTEWHANEAAKGVEGLAAAVRQLDAAKARLAARASQGDEWRRAGHRSAAHWLAQTDGCAVGSAENQLGAARTMERSEQVGEAFRSGELSRDQAAVVARAVEEAPECEAELLNVARRDSYSELKNRCRDVSFQSSRERAGELAERARRQRCVRRQVNADGSMSLSLRSSVEDVSLIDAAVRYFREPAFEAKRHRPGEREAAEVVDFDAAMLMARTALDAASERAAEPEDRIGPAAPPQNLYRVEHTALSRGHANPNERCEQAGVGPVPVELLSAVITRGAKVAVVSSDAGGRVRRVAHPRCSTRGELGWWIDEKVVIHVEHEVLRRLGENDLDRYLRALVDDGVQVDELVHGGRSPTAHQRSALEWRDPCCRVQGCSGTARLEIDHHVDWAKSRRTTLDDLGRLCVFHHALKTLYGYELEPGVGKRRLLPPARGSQSGDTVSAGAGGAESSGAVHSGQARAGSSAQAGAGDRGQAGTGGADRAGAGGTDRAHSGSSRRRRRGRTEQPSLLAPG